MNDAEAIAQRINEAQQGRCPVPGHPGKNKKGCFSAKAAHGRVLWHCFKCSQDAVGRALKDQGLLPAAVPAPAAPSKPVLAKHKDTRDDTELTAFRMLQSALYGRADNGNPAEYLRGRGIELERLPPTLMMVSAKQSRRHTGRSYPAMIAPISDGNGIIGAHVTWLSSDLSEKCNSEKPRKMFGPASGGYVALGEIDPTGPLIVAEGIESTLSAMLLAGFPGVAALSAGGMRACHPPACTECIVAADHDENGTGQKAAEELAQRLAHKGVRVRIAFPPIVGADWNDILQTRGIEKARVVWDRALAEAHAVKAADVNTDSGLIMERASDVEQKPVDWIWPGRLARGKITLIGGDPDMGKSMISADVAARITTGRRWPDAGRAPQGHVIILSAEDAPGDTICPRLEIAEGDLDRVQLLHAARDEKGKRRSFSLQTDLDRLAKEIVRIGDVKLIIVDPITAYLGSIDSHRTGDVRGLMEPLDRFARDTEVAILAVTHPPKAVQAKAINSFTGSLAFVAAARMAFVALREPDTARSLLLPVKNNLGAKAEGLAYVIEGGVTSKKIGTARVVWDKEPVTVTVEEAMQSASSTKRGNKLEQAKQFLERKLEAGPMAATSIQEAATGEGITRDTLNRAKDALGIVPEKDKSVGGKWSWGLP